MKILLWMVSIMILGSTSCQSPGNKTTPLSATEETLAHNLDDYFEALTKLRKFNGAVMVQKEGKRLLYKAYNIEEDTGKSLHVSVLSQFDIHSISKLMAKACIVRLEENGMISPENKLSKFLSDFTNGELISIQNLLDNQSGLPRELSNEPENLIEKSPSELVAMIREEQLLFTPGTETLYSNLGYELVYYVISEITGRPFVQYLQDEFFDPLEMHDSGAHFFLNKDNLINLAVNHVNEDGNIVSVPNIEKDGKSQAKIYSTLEDLMKFIDYVKESPFREKLTKENNEIGWSGGGDGILTHAKASLNSGYEIVFFSNYDDIPFGEILEDVEKIMTSKDYELPSELNRTSVTLERNIMERYVGKYDMAEFNHDEFEIRIENDSFTFYQNGEKNAVLVAENDSTLFYDPQSNDGFVFRKSENETYDLIFIYKGMEIKGTKK